MAGAVVMLELNELCPPLLERFMAAGDLPGFSRLHAESQVFTTDAGEPQDQLNPWIQWVTVHTGVGHVGHGITKLGEGAALRVPTIADVVADAGERVWLCGPMNVVPTRPVVGRWLPDPWNPSAPPSPDDLGPFAAFVRANVQEHTNVSRGLGLGDHVRFVAAMAAHGLSARTARAVARQLVGERTGRVPRWQRAALLDRFQWDVFVHHWKRERPHLATYFSNTTAHYQHQYWRYLDPDAFELRPTPEEVERLGGAIRFGYQEVDRIVSDALDRIDPDDVLVLCTALSQQPYVHADESGGSRFHRPYDLGALLAALGVQGLTRVSPVMSEQFHAYFTDERAAAAAEALLQTAVVDGEPAFALRRSGDDLLLGCAIKHTVAPAAVLGCGAVRLPFHEHLYEAETTKSGYHHPSGALWIRQPGVVPTVVDAPVDLRATAPTLLSLLGIDPPASMTTPALRWAASNPG